MFKDVTKIQGCSRIFKESGHHVKGHIWNALSLFLVEVNFEIIIFECYKTAHLKCFYFHHG